MIHPAILLKKVNKIYREGSSQVIACDQISFRIQPGERVAIVGPSGSGKSTVLNLIGLLDRPTSGQVILNGEVITARTSSRRLAHLRSQEIGFIFQNFHLLPRLTALENVMLPMVYQANRDERNESAGRSDKQRARELLAAVGLDHRYHHLPNQLSGGERQRVAIARALANKPSLILADEPTGNLDSKSGKSVISRLLQLKDERKTLLIVTHNPSIAKLMDRTITLKDGRIEKDKR